MGTPLTLIFLALVCVMHNDVKYGPGQSGGPVLALTEAEAEPLLAVGAVKLQNEEDAAALAQATQAQGAVATAAADAQAGLDALLAAKAAAQAELDALLAATAQAKADAGATAPATTPAPAPAKKK
jgi:hypothetical protein